MIAVPRFAQVEDRARAEGMRLEERRGRTYLVDGRNVWTRVVDLEDIPPDVDPDALGNTIVDLSLPDPRSEMAPYARVLELEQTRVLDDVTDYQMLLDDGVFAPNHRRSQRHQQKQEGVVHARTVEREFRRTIHVTFA